MGFDGFNITDIQALDNGGFLFIKGSDYQSIEVSARDTIFKNIKAGTYDFPKYNYTWYYQTSSNITGGGLYSISTGILGVLL